MACADHTHYSTQNRSASPKAMQKLVTPEICVLRPELSTFGGEAVPAGATLVSLAPMVDGIVFADVALEEAAAAATGGSGASVSVENDTVVVPCVPARTTPLDAKDKVASGRVTTESPAEMVVVLRSTSRLDAPALTTV